MRKPISFLLIVLVLISTININFNVHMCGDTVVDLAFFGAADNCGMMDAAPAKKCLNISSTFQKKKCCTDLHHYHASKTYLQQFQKKTGTYTSIEYVVERQTVHPVLPPHCPSNLFRDIPIDPKLRKVNFRSWFQVFII